MTVKKSRRLAIFSFLLVALLGLAYLIFQNTKPSKSDFLVIGTESGFEPFEFTQGGEIVGFDIDLAREIAKDQGKELKIEEMAFDGLIASLQAGRIDMAVAGMSVTPDRQKNVNFSDAYYQASQMIIVRQNESEISGRDDLYGKKIGVQLGTTGDNLADEIPNITKVQFPAVPAVLQELSSGRIDAVILDDTPAKRYLANRTDLRLLDEKLSEESYAIAIHKDDIELLSKVNQTLARIKTDGTYEELMDKYFGANFAPESTSLANIFLGDQRYMMLVNGLGITLLLALIATLGGTLFGVTAILMRISHFYPLRFLAKKEHQDSWLANFNPLASLAKLYTTVIRGTPVLVQLLIFYYVIFGPFRDLSKILIASVAFALNSGAYIAEILRSGFESLPKGQWEASDSLGFSYFQTIRYITMPQVLKNSLPSLMNEFITLIKETSVVGWIGLSDLMRGADNIRLQTATAFEALTVASLVYLLLTSLATRLASRVERKLKVSD